MSNTEAELKLRLADPTCLNTLLNSSLLKELSTQPVYKQLLDTTYYDTPDQRLLKSRLSYRLRLADSHWTATVKADGTSDGGLHQRAEYNMEVANPLPTLMPFMLTDIGARLTAAVGEMPLEPIFRTRFERHILNLTAPDGSKIELALDDGEILAGDKQQKLLELELELKSGQPQALIWLGAALADEFPLLPEQDSKLYRAAMLSGITDGLGQDNPLPSPLKKSSGSQPAQQVLGQMIIYHLHAIIRAQQAYLANPDGIEEVHEFRIAFRRLRALVQLAKPLLPNEEYTAWQTKLTAWSYKLAHVRDLDVFSLIWDEITCAVTTTLPQQARKSALTALVADKCQSSRANLYTEIATGQCTPVLLGLWSFIENCPAQAATEPQPTCKKFVLERLTYWLARFLKQGDELDINDLSAAHELRIASKRLRYTVESLAPILPDNTRLLTKRLEQLQNLLGQIQDTAFTPQLLQELVKASASRLTHHDAGLITGWQLAKATAAIESWDTAWAKVKKAAAKAKKLKPLENTDSNKRSPEL
ncbi:CHAD domain protein [Sporomusa ovata DSM 2662]|uniref:Adenylate cyclase n=1 Tax=Sporomusa ovata TaxID=2378 RepID=A0A0U1KZU3_9FIRM|nr:CYTH and CHAD domain-containing protein [Sporomusa ovata]EQB27998.1 CHAD domain containing protein [Sporomusa ovata DSM 2662]CQR72938.1 Adenylate cyclase [Sporomusa ovata]